MRKEGTLCLLALAFLVIAFGPQIARAQICRGSNLIYIVRDAKGVAIDARREDLRYRLSAGWSTSREDLMAGRTEAPPAVSDLSGKIVGLETFGMCSFKGPVKLNLTFQGKSMNLTFLTAPLGGYNSAYYLVDSLPFQQGTFEIDLPVGGKMANYFAPAGWKKISDTAEAVAEPTYESVRGRVVNALTKTPVANAQVKLIGLIPAKLAEQSQGKTDRNGSFEFKGLRSDLMAGAYQVATVAEHPDFADNYLLIYDKRSQSREGEAKPADFKSTEGIVLELVPLVTVTGRVVDQATGGVPADLDRLSVTFRYRKSGYLGGNISVPAGEVTTRIKPDGTFTLKTAVGQNRISSVEPWQNGGCGKCYSLADAIEIEVEIPSQGKSDVVVKLRSNPK